MISKGRAYLELHTAVILWSITAILGNLIALPAGILVFYRVLIAWLTFVPFVSLKKILKSFNKSELFLTGAVGAVLGIHWLAFYSTIKLSNSSVALICMSTTPFFTAIIEAFVNRRKINIDEILLGSVIIPAMLFIVNDLKVEFHLGVAVGILAALLAALCGTLNKRYTTGFKPMHVTYVQLFACNIVLAAAAFVEYLVSGRSFQYPKTFEDIIYIIILSTLCTNITYVLALRALKQLNAFASALTIGLEPVYGIVLSILILKENKELNLSFYIGAFVIVLAVGADAYIKNRFNRDRRVSD